MSARPCGNQKAACDHDEASHYHESVRVVDARGASREVARRGACLVRGCECEKFVRRAK